MRPGTKYWSHDQSYVMSDVTVRAVFEPAAVQYSDGKEDDANND